MKNRFPGERPVAELTAAEREEEIAWLTRTQPARRDGGYLDGGLTRERGVQQFRPELGDRDDDDDRELDDELNHRTWNDDGGGDDEAEPFEFEAAADPGDEYFDDDNDDDDAFGVLREERRRALFALGIACEEAMSLNQWHSERRTQRQCAHTYRPSRARENKRFKTPYRVKPPKDDLLSQEPKVAMRPELEELRAVAAQFIGPVKPCPPETTRAMLNKRPVGRPRVNPDHIMTGAEKMRRCRAKLAILSTTTIPEDTNHDGAVCRAGTGSVSEPATRAMDRAGKTARKPAAA